MDLFYNSYCSIMTYGNIFTLDLNFLTISTTLSSSFEIWLDFCRYFISDKQKFTTYKNNLTIDYCGSADGGRCDDEVIKNRNS